MPIPQPIQLAIGLCGTIETPVFRLRPSQLWVAPIRAKKIRQTLPLLALDHFSAQLYAKRLGANR